MNNILNLVLVGNTDDITLALILIARKLKAGETQGLLVAEQVHVNGMFELQSETDLLNRVHTAVEAYDRDKELKAKAAMN